MATETFPFPHPRQILLKMNRLFTTLCFAATLTTIAAAHCQVPCGIYGDQRRFEELLEDEQTIAKSQTQLNEIAASGEFSPQNINQIVRWTTTKEDHAQRVQQTMLDYFLAQRIKTSDPKYVEKLTAAHLVIVSAMKAKQSADPATAKSLEDSIFAFYKAYEGKEPAFNHSH